MMGGIIDQRALVIGFPQTLKYRHAHTYLGIGLVTRALSLSTIHFFAAHKSKRGHTLLARTTRLCQDRLF